MRFLESPNASRFVRASSVAFRIGALALLMVAWLSASAQAQSVVGWGYNGEGQTSPPAGLTDVEAVAAGAHHSLALKHDGTVVAWGSDGAGQATVPEGLANVVAIGAGGFHSVALKGDGTVVAWGIDRHLGETDVPAGLTDVVAIAVGLFHNLALKGDGSIVGWGDDSSGQLSAPAGLTDVAAIAAGGAHSLALKSDGTVVGWGHNFYGQSSVPAGLANVVAIAAGREHSLALKSDGTVVGWGSDAYGQLPLPAGLTNVVAIAATYTHSLALKSDGTVVAWGSNGFDESTVPPQLADVLGIAAGHFHSLAIVSNRAPSVTTQAVTRTAGSVATRGPVANLIDESLPSALTLTIDGAATSSAHGVTVSALSVDANGLVTANVGAICGASNAAFSLRATDPDGLSTDARLDVMVTAESTPPTLVLPGNIVATLPTSSSATSMPVTFTVTATDNCGSATVTTTPASGSLFSVGTTIVVATATDAAGNTASGSFTLTVRYAFDGFFSPVSNLPVVNRVNAGQAIPLKFSLGGNKGLNIFAAGSPTSNAMACTFSGGVTEIAPTVTPGSSDLSYDAGSDRYHYVWKTSKAWANSCRQLVITLRDGSTHVANFEFK